MSNTWPKLKICGITSVRDAEMAVDLGVSYLGLNFYPRSPRCIDVERALEIRQAVAGKSVVVGLFVNHPTAEVERIDRHLALDLLQFHGDEAPEDLEPFASRALVAVRSGGREGEDGTRASDPAVERRWQHRGDFWGVLFDRAHRELYGGSGESWDYRSLLARLEERSGHGGVESADGPLRVFVAGGIGPDNIAEVARDLRDVDALDICSSVEAEPGIKDERLLGELIDRWNAASVEENAKSL